LQGDPARVGPVNSHRFDHFKFLGEGLESHA
jgi:hypothetical protein